MGKQVKFDFVPEEETTPKFDFVALEEPPVKKKGQPVSAEPAQPSVDGGSASKLDFQPLEKPTVKQEERNPLVTFGKKAYSTLVNQVAPNTSLAIQALLNQGLETLEQGVSKIPGAKTIDKFLNENVGEIPALSKLHKDYLLKNAVGFAEERSKADQEMTKDLVNRYTQIHDATSAVNWATGALSQAAAQIVPAIVTGGASAAGQEIGSIYLDSVNKIAEHNKMTPEEVIDKGMDEKAIAIAAGLGAGALEMIGARGVAGAFSKSPAGKVFRSKMLEFIKSPAAKEAGTEAAQTVIEHAGAVAGTKKSIGENAIDIAKDISSAETIADIKESAAQGAVGGGGLAAVGSALNREKPIAPVGDLGKTTNQLITEEKARVNTSSNIQAAKDAADVIQEKVNEQSNEAIAGIVQTPNQSTEEIKNAIPVGESTAVPVEEPSGNSGQVGQRISESEKPAEPQEGVAKREGEKNEEVIPEDLEKSGEQPSSRLDVESRFGAGERIFAFPEMDEAPVELHSVAEMRKYTVDQLLAYPQKSEEKNDIQKELPKGVVSYEDATKITSDIDPKGLPEGNDEGSMEARSQMLRDREKNPPTWNKYPVGTYAVDKYGELHQLQEVPINNLVTKDEGTQRKETVDKYTEWTKESGNMPPAKGVENFAVHNGKVVITDGNHRVLAAKQAGRKTVPVWVALTDPEKNTSPLKVFDIERHKKLTEQAEPSKVEQQRIKIAKDYTEEIRNPRLSAQESAIREEISKVSAESIERYGDKNAITPAIRKAYVGGDDTLDKISQRASLSMNPNGDGNDISPEEVWDFMKKYEMGPRSLDTPKGNPRLLELSNQHIALTGKGINRKTAKDIIDAARTSFGKEDANTHLSTLFDAQGNVDEGRLLAELEVDPQAFQTRYGLNNEEFEEFQYGLRQGQSNQGSGENRGSDQPRALGPGDEPGEIEPAQGFGSEIIPPPNPPGNMPHTGPRSEFPGKGNRETIAKLQEESNLTEPLKAAIEDFATYDKHKQSKTQAEARSTIDRLGEDEALREATSFKVGRTQEQKIALLSELAERFATQFRKAPEGQKDSSYGKFMRAMDMLANYVTDTAQALSYMNLVGAMFETQAGAVRFAKNQIEQSREGALKNHEALKDNARKILEEKAAMDEEIRRQVEAKVQQTVGERLAKAKLITREQRQKIASAFDKLKVNTKNNIVTASVIPGLTLLPHVWNGSVEVMKQAVLTGADVANAIQSGIDYIKSQTKDAFDETKFKEFLTPIITDLATDKKNKIEKIVNKYLPKDKPKETRKKKEFYDKVIELSDAGAVTDEQMNDQLAKIFDLPAMTPAIAERIGELVDDINKAPAGRFKNIAITKLTDYIAQQQRFNITNYMLASYKAGIFSGIDTQALNLQGNIFNVMELGFVLGITNPKRAAQFYKAFANPNSLSRSGKEALKVLRTGFDPRDTGGTRRALEQRAKSFFGLGKPLKGWRQAFDPSLEQQKKYVFRALSAGDLLFSTGINDALQHNLFIREANKKGLTGKDATAYVNEQMGYSPENIKNAGAQAEQEATSGAIPKDKDSKILRTYEIIEQQRDPQIVQKSRQYASEQIMTNTPKGYIGIVARSLNNLIQQIPILSAFIPVVNFAANAMSRAVQYMPHTALAREIAHDISKLSTGQSVKSIYQEKLNGLKNGDLDTEMRLRRAAIGVISMATMLALLSDDEDDENLLSKLLGKKVTIHGFGPGTQLNRQKNYQKQETGWKPYSIQIGDKYFSYNNYPALNVLLATMGEWNDAKKYGKLTNKDASQRLGFALLNSGRVIAEMGFLTSLNTLTSSLLEGNIGTFGSTVSRTASGVIPKFWRNIHNLFDNKIYSNNDIQELVTRSIPVINSYANEPLVNALGEPIEKNWWDRIELWQEKSYSKNESIWKANNDKQYYFPVPSKFSIEQKFGRNISSAEYNDYFKNRGDVIVKEWDPKTAAALNKKKYHDRMDVLVRYADYKTLVKMGVMDSDIMKEIRFQLQDIQENKKELQQMRKSLKP